MRRLQISETELMRAAIQQEIQRIRLIFLPPYSPDLNVIERVWKLTRFFCTHNRYFPELADLVSAVCGQLEQWSKPNETLRRLCAII